MPKSKTPQRKATNVKNLSAAQMKSIAEHYAASVASVRKDPKPVPRFVRTGYDRVELSVLLPKESNDKRGDLVTAIRDGAAEGNIRFRPGAYRVIVERVWTGEEE